MPIPGNAEPMACSGQQQVQQHQSINFSHAIPIKKRRSPARPSSSQQQVQQHQSSNFSNAIPIKKRRFPIIQPPSPPREEKPSRSEGQGSNNKQEAKILDESDERKIASPGDSDVSKTSTLIVKKEFTPTNMEFGQATAGIPASTPLVAKARGSLGPKDELKHKMNILRNVKPLVPEVPKRSIGAQKVNVKQEIISGQAEDTRSTLEVSRGSMSIELSLGTKEPVSPAVVHQSNEAFPRKSGKSDPSLLSLAFREENRSNWDLNTTMDVWGEGTNNSDPYAHRLVDIGGFKKNNSCQDEKSSLTTVGSVSLSFNEGKQSIQQHKINDSLGLRLSMPYKELNLLQAQISATNVNTTVKQEPVDENSKRDCSIGSSSSSNMGLTKFGSVKMEFVNNQETLLQKSKCAEKLLDHRLIKSELVQEGTKQACKFGEGIRTRQPVAKVMQHQESCVSSSALSVPLLPQNSSRLAVCSELTTIGDLSNQSEHSFQSKELYDPCDVPDEQIASMVSKSGETQLRPSKVQNSSHVVFVNKCKLARVDEHISELCQSSELAANEGEKMNLSVEMEDAFGSDCETQENCGVDSSMHVDENVSNKEDEEYEDGEVREALQDSVGEGTIFEGKKTENLKLVESDSVLLGDQKIASDLNREEDAVKENNDDPSNNSVGTSYEPLSEDNSLQKLSEEVLEVGVDNQSSINITSAKKLDTKAANDVEESHLKEVSILSCATAVTSPCKTRTIPSRLLTSRSGKERYSDPDGNRDEIYNGGPNKFVKDRNSRPTFTVVKGRISNRFGSMRGEWDSDRNFGSENNSYGPSDYRFVRHKYASSSIPDVELECNGYGIPQDGTSLVSNRRKGVNDEFPNLRLNSLRRLSPGGERDGPITRNNQMFRRIPRNMGPNRCNVEDDSEMLGIRHNDKFMRHLSDDMMDPVYNRPQAMYDELEGQQLFRGNRNNYRKVYNHNPRIRSKSPSRSQTRSPGPWSSPRRRSPNGLQELNQHRSPAMYRMGRVRSPDRSCFRDEMVSRRRGSPSYVSRHVPNDMRDSDSVHLRTGNSNRRGGGSPGRLFPRSGRRRNELDSREMEDGDEFINGPLHSNKFHGEGNIDERRKFIRRGGPPVCSFRPNYGNEGENFRFHMNDGPRPYRFCPDGDAEFVERSNLREREFDGRIKHQSFGSRRIRNIEEQQDGSYRPFERVWHDNDGFDDARVKRKRF